MGRITAIAAGTVFDEAGHGWQPGSSYAIQDDGTAWTWGYQGMAKDIDHPRQIRLERPIKQISGSFLLTDDGIARQINETGTTVISGLSDIVAIDESVTPSLLYALKADGTVWYRERDAGQWSRLGEYTDIKAIYGTAFCLFVQKSSGELIFIEGGGRTHPSEGVQVPLLRNAVQVEPGANNDALILDEAGEVFLFIASDMEVTPIKQAAGALRIAYAGGERYLFLKKDGTVWGFGENRDGLLGEGINPVEKPLQLPNLNNIVDIRLGTSHGIALDKKGMVYTWGSNMTGQLGRLPLLYNEWTGWGELTDVRKVIPVNEQPYFIRKDDSLWTMAEDHRLVEIAAAKGTTELVFVNYLPVTLNKEGQVQLWQKDFAASEPLSLPYPVQSLAADESKLIVFGTNRTLEVLHFSGKDGKTVYNSKVTANKLTVREKVAMDEGVAGKVVSLHATPYTFLALTEDGQLLFTVLQKSGYAFKAIAELPPIQTVAAEFFVRHNLEPLTVWALDRKGTVHEIQMELDQVNKEIQAVRARVLPRKETGITAIAGKWRVAADGTTYELGGQPLTPASPLRLLSVQYSYAIEGPGNQFALAIGEDQQIYVQGDNPFGHSDAKPQPLNWLQ
jgi:alpha-tubulin suppressor-like RCC1 family protein